MKQDEPGPPTSVSPNSLGQRIRWHRLRLGLSQEALAEAIGASTRSVRRWEQDLVLPQKAWRERLSSQFGLGPQDLLEAFSNEGGEQHASLPPTLWTIPYARNSCFTGRETVLQTVHSLLRAHQSVALTQAIALSGLGGIGKTQVALEYAYRYGQEYQAVFWLAAESSESLMVSLQQMADLIQLPEREAAEQSQLTSAMRRWLTSHQNWLVIADNVEDLDVLQPLLPALVQGTLLLTTRRQALGTLARSLEVPPMSEEEGIELLLARSGQPHLHAAKASLLPTASQDASTVTQAAELVRFMEGLPLALDQAGSYLQETGCQVADYVQRYQQQRKELLLRRGLHAGNHPASVATTVLLAVEQIAHEHPAAPDLLYLCAFLHPDAIPEKMLTAGASHLGPALGPVIANPYQFDLLLAAVRSVSLVSRHAERKTLSMHRLVQAVLKDEMSKDLQHTWITRCSRLLERSFPVEGDLNVEQREWCKQLIPHVLLNVAYYAEQEMALPEVASLCYNAATYLRDSAQYEQAEMLYQQALRLQEQLLVPAHPNLVYTLCGLATLYWEQGRYTEAEPLYQRALCAFDQVSDSVHPDMGRPLYGLATLYWEQGRYTEAEPLFQRALAIFEQTLDLAHPDIARVLNGLAALYKHQGRYVEAEPLYQRALRIFEQASGSMHPLVGYPVNNLAGLYREQGRYEQAEPLFQHALQIWEQALGSEHPLVAHPLNNLAEIYLEQGQYEQAETLFQRALHIWEQALGTEHPLVAHPLNNLAEVYLEQGQYEQAETLARRALKIREQTLGPEHPDTAISLNTLAMISLKLNKYIEAEPLLQRALKIREQQLGPEHLDTAKSLYSLALLRQAQENSTEAQSLFERALHIRTQVLGPQHPQTRKISASLAELLQTQGKK